MTRYLDKGGMEEVIMAYARFLRRGRYALTVATMGKGSIASAIEHIGSVRLEWIPGDTHAKRFLALLSLARSLKPSIVHNHFNWYGLIVGAMTGAKRVETMHNLYGWLTGYHRVAYAVYLLFASRIIAVSASVLKFNREYFRIIPRRKCIVVHNGVDIEAFSNAAADHGIRRKLGIGESTVVFVFVGRLEPQKGLHTLLEAAAIIRRSRTEFALLIAGEGSLHDSLIQSAHDTGLDNVYFLGYRQDVARLLKACDVFVLPSSFEGLPLSMLEAMAGGLPVIATDVGGIPEALTDGLTGFLIPPADPEALAHRMTVLIADPARRKVMGQHASARARDHFSARRMVESTEEIYEDLLQVSGTAPPQPAGREK